MFIIWIYSVNIIVGGGTPSLRTDFRHMAALGYGNEDDIQWLCGGSVISNKFVLTAAHCVSSPKLGAVKLVRLGAVNLTDTSDSNTIDFDVQKFYIHPNYKPPAKYHDIALLELNGTVTLSIYIKAAILHKTKEIPGYTTYVTGWGQTEYYGSPSEYLLFAILNIVPFDVCSNSYKSIGKRRLPKGIDDETQLCAGQFKKDTCSGDSGGPLQVFNGRFNTYTILGVTSFGKACLTNQPGVYTRVSFYIDWIQSIAEIKEPTFEDEYEEEEDENDF